MSCNKVQTLENQIESLENRVIALENKIEKLISYNKENTHKEELIEDIKRTNEKEELYDDEELYNMIKYKSISYLEDVLERLDSHSNKCQSCKDIGCGKYCDCSMCD